ncbi:MAG: DNA alkylation repair protein [Verrucomicrobiota bacterium]
MTLRKLRQELRPLASPVRARVSQSFFKTGPGEYGAGDRFIGLTVPQIRRLAKQCRQLSLPETKQLLQSPIHEERLLALLILVGKFAAEDDAGRQLLYATYLRNTRFINNWDLVDSSAEHIVGAFLRSCSGASVKRRLVGQKKLALRRSAATTLLKLARSQSLWERRIAIIATFHFIKRGEFAPTLRIGRQLLRDREDLIHKAVGWMLREVGKRDSPTAEKFLRMHYRRMPRTMLRYAIERLPERRRQCYLKGTIN